MKVLVVDDERLARQRLCQQLQELGISDTREAANGLQALECVQHEHPEIVLLDIRMPLLDGVETARHRARETQPPAVIFTTAFGEHALEAFDTHAVAYLLKPVRRDRLAAALQVACTPNRAQLRAISSDGSDARTHLCARVGERLEQVAIEEVLYFQADQKYVTVGTATRQVLIEEALKSLEQEFAPHFVRIHRNALVARAALCGLEKDDNGALRVLLRGCPERLEVSRRHGSEIRRLLQSGR